MLEPIPFGGWVDLDSDAKTRESVERLLKDMLGDDPQSDIKYVILTDGSVYFFKKEGDRYAICEQAPTIQKGV